MDVTTPSPTTTALRDFAKAVGGFLVGAGIITESQASLWTGIIVFVATSGYAIWKQIKMRDKSSTWL